MSDSSDNQKPEEKPEAEERHYSSADEEEERRNSTPEKKPKQTSPPKEASPKEAPKKESPKGEEKKEESEPKKEEAGETKSEDQPQSEAEVPHMRKSSMPPVIVNPIMYYKCHEKYNWRLQQVNSAEFLQKLEAKIQPDLYELEVPKDVEFVITATANIKGHIHYTARIKDKKGSRQVTRRYTEYIAWKNKLNELWPCIFLASLPSKTIFGTNEQDLISNRSKFIIRFLRSLSHHEAIYNSQQVQLFLNQAQQGNMETHYLEFPKPKSLQILEKYKKTYADEYIYSQREEFMYRKDTVPQLLEQYENYFSNKKIDLMNYLSSIRKLAQSKQNYYRAINKLNQTLLPEYQDTLYRWIYGESLPKTPANIVERISMKVNSIKQPEESNPTETQKPKQEVSQADQAKESKTQQVQAKFGLYSTESYKSKLQDTALLIHDYNSSTHQIYDAVKFELKQIDTVLLAVEQTKSLSREMDYVKRTININKQQIEALNSNKTTLKTFFMEGNTDDKKTKLTNDNQILEQQLQKITELYYLIMVLLEKQLEQFHRVRSRFYVQSMQKAFTDELCLTKSIMDFHVFEEQLFAKDRQQRMKLFMAHQQEEEEQKGQIKE